LFKRNPALLTDFQLMREAYARLHQALASEAEYGVLTDVARDIHGFVNTRFKTRVMGALINGYRVSEGAKPGSINAVMIIKAIKSDEVLTIGRKS
jgi:hypothetical protein